MRLQSIGVVLVIINNICFDSDNLMYRHLQKRMLRTCQELVGALLAKFQNY